MTLTKRVPYVIFQKIPLSWFSETGKDNLHETMYS
jgi:hypothetical protein